ncbi:YadA-like family protein [Escherichia coli]
MKKTVLAVIVAAASINAAHAVDTDTKVFLNDVLEMGMSSKSVVNEWNNLTFSQQQDAIAANSVLGTAEFKGVQKTQVETASSTGMNGSSHVTNERHQQPLIGEPSHLDGTHWTMTPGITKESNPAGKPIAQPVLVSQDKWTLTPAVTKETTRGDYPNFPGESVESSKASKKNEHAEVDHTPATETVKGAYGNHQYKATPDAVKKGHGATEPVEYNFHNDSTAKRDHQADVGTKAVYANIERTNAQAHALFDAQNLHSVQVAQNEGLTNVPGSTPTPVNYANKHAGTEQYDAPTGNTAQRQGREDGAVYAGTSPRQIRAENEPDAVVSQPIRAENQTDTASKFGTSYINAKNETPVRAENQPASGAEMAHLDGQHNVGYVRAEDLPSVNASQYRTDVNTSVAAQAADEATGHPKAVATDEPTRLPSVQGRVSGVSMQTTLQDDSGNGSMTVEGQTDKSYNLDEMQEDIASNHADVSVITDRLHDNDKRDMLTQLDVDQNTADIATNKGEIAANTTAIAANTTAIAGKVDSADYATDKAAQHAVDQKQHDEIVAAGNTLSAHDQRITAAQTTADAAAAGVASVATHADAAQQAAITAETHADAAKDAAGLADKHAVLASEAASKASDAVKNETATREGQFKRLSTDVDHAQATGDYAKARIDAAGQVIEQNRLALRATNQAVAEHTAELANHEQRIQTLESNTNAKFGQLKSEVEQNRKRASAGIAGVAAMANIPQVTQGATFSVGAGAGNTDGESALAVGFSARASENVVVKASVSNDTQHNFVIGAGASYQW